jgi:hypothetical protein
MNPRVAALVNDAHLCVFTLPRMSIFKVSHNLRALVPDFRKCEQRTFRESEGQVAFFQQQSNAHRFPDWAGVSSVALLFKQIAFLEP